MYEDELRDLMLAVDVPPTTADVYRAVATGRRRARRRTIVTSGIAGVAVVTAVSTFVAFGPMRAGPTGIVGGPPASAGCAVSVLPLPRGVTTGIAEVIDPTGIIYAGFSDVMHAQPAIWKDQRLQQLTGVSGRVVAVGADGTVVGYTGDYQNRSTGWVYRGGAATTLAKVTGYAWTNPSAINAHGEIAGWAHGTGLDENTPVVWSASGVPRKLTLPPGIGAKGATDSRATDIADDGTVVGVMRGVPVLWKPDGTPQALPLPAGEDSGFAWAIAGPYVYGTAGADNVRWDLRTGRTTKLPNAGDFGVRDGTADGTALVRGDGTHPSLRVRTDGHVDTLSGPHGQRAVATSMSADGTTLVGMTYEEKALPLVWHCVD